VRRITSNRTSEASSCESTMGSEIEKSVKIIPFTESSNWTVWSCQFLARAHGRGYKNVVLGRIICPSFDEKFDLSTDEGKLKSVARRANDNAYTDLMLSFTDLANFTLIHKAKTKLLPDGDAALAWASLVSKHEPKTSANRVALKLEFENSELKSVKKDPEDWIAGLESLRIKMDNAGLEITDFDFIIHIIHNLPKEYESIADQLESDLDNSNLEVTIDSIKARLRAKYNKIKNKKNLLKRSDGDDDEETALFAGKGFKGRCNHCGTYGHKGVDCKKKLSNHQNPQGPRGYGKPAGGFEKKKFDGACHYCGIKGHREANCFKKQRDDKDKNGGETANAATKKDGDEEFLLSCTEQVGVCEHSQTKYFIGDTGASSHMVNSLKGVYDIEDYDADVKLGDGSTVKAMKKGKF
jgi:gag-polypeptide of LTR copia-type